MVYHGVSDTGDSCEYVEVLDMESWSSTDGIGDDGGSFGGASHELSSGCEG